MDTKHTPGPWHTANTGNHQGVVIAENGANVAVVYDKKDAHLIAAAPSLLDSAKKALDFIQSLPYEPSNTTSTKAQDALVDAIAKAEGR